MLLDAGANVECRPQHLLQFAIMGAVHARLALGIERPRVGLLSIGEEETKGNELTREAHRLLKAAPMHFIGNIEGREIYSGEADVIVCDGFTGNVVLKTSEGLVEVVDAVLGEALAGRCRRARDAVRTSSADGWTTRNTAARRCWAWPAWSSSATAARRRRPCGTRLRMAARFATGDFVEPGRTRDRRRVRTAVS